MVGPNGFEPATSRLSGVRSNQLSYGPAKKVPEQYNAVPTARQELFSFSRQCGTDGAYTASDPSSRRRRGDRRVGRYPHLCPGAASGGIKRCTEWNGVGSNPVPPGKGQQEHASFQRAGRDSETRRLASFPGDPICETILRNGTSSGRTACPSSTRQCR